MVEVVTRMEGFAADFQGMARENPELASLANGFSAFVKTVDRTWGIPLAQEIDEPEIER